MGDERKNMLTGVFFWAWCEGMEVDVNDVSSDILIAKKGEHKIAFITEFDRSRIELFYKIASLKREHIDYIYVVTNDNGKRRELIKVLPDHCGIFFHGDPFGLGGVYMVLKEPKQISK